MKVLYKPSEIMRLRHNGHLLNENLKKLRDSIVDLVDSLMGPLNHLMNSECCDMNDPTTCSTIEAGNVDEL